MDLDHGADRSVDTTPKTHASRVGDRTLDGPMGRVKMNGYRGRADCVRDIPVPFVSMYPVQIPVTLVAPDPCASSSTV